MATPCSLLSGSNRSFLFGLILTVSRIVIGFGRNFLMWMFLSVVLALGMCSSRA